LALASFVPAASPATTSDVFDDPGPGARLSDGAVLPAGMGELYLAQRSTVSVFAWAPIGICDLGVVPSLAETPTDPGACLGAPMDSIVLGGNADALEHVLIEYNLVVGGVIVAILAAVGWHVWRAVRSV
jgi:hypothetical protein